MLPPPFPWAQPEISLEEVSRRLQAPRDGHVKRHWPKLAGSYTTDSTPNRYHTHWYISYSRKALVPGRAYLVVAYVGEDEYSRSSSEYAAVAAGVLVFQEYVPHPEAEARLRYGAHLEAESKREEKANARAAAEEEEEFGFEVGELGGEDDPLEKMQERQEQRYRWRKAGHLLRFRAAGGGEGAATYDVDAYGPPVQVGALECHINVLPMTSQRWDAHTQDFIVLPHNTDMRKGRPSMDRLRRGVMRHYVRVAAARIIQRRWRKAFVDPSHPVCQRRLRAEFDDLGGGKRQRREGPEAGGAGTE